MISLVNRVADVHFRRDPSGPLVFIPFAVRGKCYFVDSKADEELLDRTGRHFSSAGSNSMTQSRCPMITSLPTRDSFPLVRIR